MNRADRMLEVLRDGRKRTRREIFEAAGEFFMTNNAAAELRARGVDVVHTRQGRVDCYQLREPDDTTVSTPAKSGSRSGSESPSHPGTDSPEHVPTSADGPFRASTCAAAVLLPEGAAAPPTLFKTCGRCGKPYDGVTGHGPYHCEKQEAA